MEREVRYCTTGDGVRVAYCVEGEGAPTILALPAFNETLSLDHLMPVYQQFYRDLGVGRRVIRFDWRGSGLSADLPDGASVIVETRLRDLEAVARAAGQACVIWASTIAGPAAIQFAATHPDLVSSLILYDTFADIADAMSQTLRDAFADLARANWRMAAQTIADTNGRREFPEEAAQLGDWYYRSQSAEMYVSRNATPPDAGPSLSQVQVPALVLHRIADPVIPFSAGQKLAAGIPGARFAPLEGEGHLFCLGDYSKILSAVAAFLGDAAPAATGHAQEKSAFRTVLFTDIVGHTEMMQRLGDAKGRDVLREHERITRETLKQHGGAEVKTMGDGFMASFSSVTSAVDCAIALQRAFANVQPPMSNIQIRAGLNAGEPIEEDGDLFGATVILASRIAAKAGAGEIFIPEHVRHLLSGKSYVYADRGEHALKGFDDAVRLYEVRWLES